MKKTLVGIVAAVGLLVASPSPAWAVADPSSWGGLKTPDREKVIKQIKRAWGRGDNRAIRVAECESGLNPKATSPGETYLGLWQFSRATWSDYDGPGNDPRDVNAFRQTQVAYRLFQDRGWAPWPTCGSR